MKFILNSLRYLTESQKQEDIFLRSLSNPLFINELDNHFLDSIVIVDFERWLTIPENIKNRYRFVVIKNTDEYVIDKEKAFMVVENVSSGHFLYKKIENLLKNTAKNCFVYLFCTESLERKLDFYINKLYVFFDVKENSEKALTAITNIDTMKFKSTGRIKISDDGKQFVKYYERLKNLN